MKFNVHFKILTIFLLCFFIVIFLFNYSFQSAEKKNDITAGKIITKGVLISIEEKLLESKKTEWKQIISLSTANNNYLSLIPIKQIKYSDKEKKMFDSGKIIFYSGANYQLLNQGLVEYTAYKKIADSSYALAYKFERAEQLIDNTLLLAIKLIAKTLKSRQDKLQSNEIIKLEKRFGFPIKVYSLHDKKLPKSILKQLNKRKIAFSTISNTTRIDTVYYLFDKKNILEIGPIKYLPITGRISDAQYYFILSSFIIALLFIVVLTSLFVRNMKKIYQITKHYSHSDFKLHTKVSKTSVLYGLYSNISTMGEKLKQLIESHKQLCRFVAHETRTPLSTMKMTIDNMKRTQTLDNRLQDKLDSIQEDISDINSLVSTFLIYSQLQSQELTLNKTKTNIVSWLENLVSKYHFTKFDISLDIRNNDHIIACIDVKLFRHAMNNLITNATKFAKSKIHISIEELNGHLLIHVDDDGPGVADDISDEIFSEYFCAWDVQTSDKHIGLGLAIVKKVMLLLDGDVTVSNSPILSGACFTLVLPISTLC